MKEQFIKVAKDKLNEEYIDSLINFYSYHGLLRYKSSYEKLNPKKGRKGEDNGSNKLKYRNKSKSFNRRS